MCLSWMGPSVTWPAARCLPASSYGAPQGECRAVVYIAGGNTLISSRVFERVGVHAKAALQEGLLQKFPDLENVNSDFVQVHWSSRSLDFLPFF